MTRPLAWLVVVGLFALAVAACGDDGGNNACVGDECDEEDLCGNGRVEVSMETCDDGNQLDGDGCSSRCQSECGNGSVDGDEQCDDGNTLADDGCTGSCTIELGYTCDGEPSECIRPTGKCDDPYLVPFVDAGSGVLTAIAEGDTSDSTDQVEEAECDGFPSGGGNDHLWRFTITEPRDIRISVDSATSFDSMLRLLTVACDVSSEVPEHLTTEGCSDEFGPDDTLTYVALPAGTYYIVLDSYDQTEVGTYKFFVSSSPSLCGNGMVDGDAFSGEQCDDGNQAMSDGCDVRCDVEAGYACEGEPSMCGSACGNGSLDPGEECDDDNTVVGDRCSPTCTLEATLVEAEPNNTAAQAQVVSLTNHQIRGSLTAGDVDLYSITLTAPATIEFETYDTIIADEPYDGYGSLEMLDCQDFDSEIRIFPMGADVTVNSMALYYDDQDGADSCSYIGPGDQAGMTTQGALQPGTYIIKVNSYFSFGTVDRYILDIKATTTSAVPPVAGDLVLNEFMAADNMSDTNCDGVVTGTNDEFIELINVSNKIIDLTGVQIFDLPPSGPLLRHTFAPNPSGSMMLAPGKAVVVWAGGSPACPGVDNWFTAVNGQNNGLGLNDLGDTITVKNAAGETLIEHMYPSATLNVSLNRTPDVQGPSYVNHNTLPGAVGAWSPGTRANGMPF